MVARLLREQEVGSSNLLAPTFVWWWFGGVLSALLARECVRTWAAAPDVIMVKDVQQAVERVIEYLGKR